MAIKLVHPVVANLGKNIFIYTNIQTKRVVYSLTRSLKNNAALKQLTFVGKKSVPHALRKDIWTPMVSVEFPFPEIGLKTFKKLREFRKLHETAYPKELVQGKNRKQKKYILMDQKANSIADLAVSLEWEITQANKRAEETKETKNPAPAVGRNEVVLMWHNINDPWYAKSWSDLVLHKQAQRAVRYTAPPKVEQKPELLMAPTSAQTMVV